MSKFTCNYQDYKIICSFDEYREEIEFQISKGIDLYYSKEEDLKIVYEICYERFALPGF